MERHHLIGDEAVAIERVGLAADAEAALKSLGYISGSAAAKSKWVGKSGAGDVGSLIPER